MTTNEGAGASGEASKRRHRRRRARARLAATAAAAAAATAAVGPVVTSAQGVDKIDIGQSQVTINYSPKNMRAGRDETDRAAPTQKEEEAEAARQRIRAERQAKKVARGLAKGKPPPSDDRLQVADNLIIGPKSTNTSTVKTAVSDKSTVKREVSVKKIIGAQATHTSTVKPSLSDKSTVKPEVADKSLVKPTVSSKSSLKLAVSDKKTVNIPVPSKSTLKPAVSDKSSVKPIVTDKNTTKSVANDKCSTKPLITGNCTAKPEVSFIVEVTDQLLDIKLGSEKGEEMAKSKAELRAERRAKQEAQRAAKLAAASGLARPPAAAATPAAAAIPAAAASPAIAPAAAATPAPAAHAARRRVNWFQHLYSEREHAAADAGRVPINCKELHPAVVRLGVQLASRVIVGSNARCVALLDALKKVVSEYSLPARTEFSRGLEAQLAGSEAYLRASRPMAASMTNAIKHIRWQLTQLPNNITEFEAKCQINEAIDTYIRDQIEVAGEAISIAVRAKISHGDYILTYGCSSLVEKILKEAWSSGLKFRAVVVGTHAGAEGGGRDALRRLAAHGVPTAYVHISALSFVMRTVNKVVLGAASLLGNGWVLAGAGTAQVALVARAYNVPVLVCCQTHKFSERVQTDAFVYNEIGDPDSLVGRGRQVETSALRVWRQHASLTPLALAYDVTPPTLVTAVVTELAVLPCTSAPVVLRFKLSEYGL